MTEGTRRAFVLCQQGRWKLAEQTARNELAADAENGFAYLLLALCHLHHNRHREATTAAEHAIRYEPHVVLAYVCLARSYFYRDLIEEAQTAIDTALLLKPDVAVFEVQSRILLQQGRWSDALQAAEQGIAMNPDDGDCNYLRSVALEKLGRREEAYTALRTTLAKHPESSALHTRTGWVVMDQGHQAEALAHFREALRLEPHSESARAGYSIALKSRRFLYRWLLFLSRQSNWSDWLAVITGATAFYLVYILRVHEGDWAAVAAVVAALYFAVIVLIWIADPLFNLLLRFSRTGRHVLSRREIVQSNWLTVFLAVPLLSLLGWLVFRADPLLLIAMFTAPLLIPVGAALRCKSQWPRRFMIGYTCVLVFLLACLTSLMVITPPLISIREWATAFSISSTLYFRGAFWSFLVGKLLIRM